MAPRKLLSSKVATFLAVFTATQSVVGCITNAIVLFYLLLTRRSPKTTADKLILNLTIADFIALSTYVPWRSYILIGRVVTKLSRIYTSLFVTCIFSTGNAILLIGLDRFVAVVWPLRYKALITCKLFWIAIIAAWLSAILLGVGHGFSYSLGIHNEYELFLCALSFSQLIVLSTITLSYYEQLEYKQGTFLEDFNRWLRSKIIRYGRQSVQHLSSFVYSTRLSFPMQCIEWFQLLIKVYQMMKNVKHGAG